MLFSYLPGLLYLNFKCDFHWKGKFDAIQRIENNKNTRHLFIILDTGRKSTYFVKNHRIQNANKTLKNQKNKNKKQPNLQSYTLPTRHRCVPHGIMKQSGHNGCVDSSESTLSCSQSALVCLLSVT